jgi:hypothetical protein
MNKQNLLYVSIAALVLDVLGSTTHLGAITAIGGLVSLAVWIMGMIMMARIKRWGWFVAILFLSPLATLLYGIMGPTAPKGSVMPTYPTSA